MTLVWASGYNGITDPDAQTYIAAVEAADGQAIEGNVAFAVNDFVIGCKTDGIWDAIKASCILAGARTLAGALVPLKGTAPTNNNFVSGDYNRETGLVGNETTKYLDSNRANNADPQNNNHYAVFVSVVPSATGALISSTGSTGAEPGTILLAYDVVNGMSSRNKSATVGLTSGFGTGLKGMARSSSASYVTRNTSANSVISTASDSSGSGLSNLHIYRRMLSGGSSNIGFNGRLSFYSIGESIDLEKLDTRTTQLMNGISYGVSPDADAQTYIQAVETADNRKLEFHVAAAINAFVVGCKADGIWNAIKSSCILAGARTLAGALVPLVGTAPENGSAGSYQFVEADYDRKLGLQGSKASPFPILLANRLSSDDPQDNHHCSVYVTEQGTTSGNNVIVYVSSGLDYTQLYWYNNTVLTRSRAVTAFVSPNISGLGATLLGISRSASTEFKTRYYGTTVTTSSTSNTPANYEYRLFGAGNTTNFNGRATFYSIGESLDLALLDNRVSTLMTDIGAAIP